MPPGSFHGATLEPATIYVEFCGIGVLEEAATAKDHGQNRILPKACQASIASRSPFWDDPPVLDKTDRWSYLSQLSCAVQLETGRRHFTTASVLQHG
jgi:hypothetical protein